MIFTIDTSKLQTFKDSVDGFIPDPDADNSEELSTQAEEAITTLLSLEVQVKDALKAVKEQMQTQGEERFGDSFRAIKGDKVTIGYQFAGGQSEFEPAGEMDSIKEDFLSTKTSLDTTAIRKYRKEYDELPPGIGLAERKKTIVIRVAR